MWTIGPREVDLQVAEFGDPGEASSYSSCRAPWGLPKLLLCWGGCSLGLAGVSSGADCHHASLPPHKEQKEDTSRAPCMTTGCQWKPGLKSHVAASNYPVNPMGTAAAWRTGPGVCHRTPWAPLCDHTEVPHGHGSSKYQGRPGPDVSCLPRPYFLLSADAVCAQT